MIPGENLSPVTGFHNQRCKNNAQNSTYLAK